jgi:hypothetical protein
MDASQYLRRLKESQPKTLARANVISAGQRTDMLAKAATTTFARRDSNILTCRESCIAQTGGPIQPAPGCMSRVAHASSNVEPIKPVHCLSAAMCNDFALRYAAPIVLPCKPMLYAPATYVLPYKVQPYYGTPAQTAKAVAQLACADCRPPSIANASMQFTSGSYVAFDNNTDFKIGKGAFTVEWFQYFVPDNDTNTAANDNDICRVFSFGNTQSENIAFSIERETPDTNGYHMYLHSGQYSYYFGKFADSGPNTHLPESDLLNKWAHMAVVGYGDNTIKLFVNGAQFGPTLSVEYNFDNGIEGYLTIGNRIDALNTSSFIGYISNFRLVVGHAVYTTTLEIPTFPIPTSRLSAIAGTKLLLLCARGAPYDDSSTDGRSHTESIMSIGLLTPFS